MGNVTINKEPTEAVQYFAARVRHELDRLTGQPEAQLTLVEVTEVRAAIVAEHRAAK